MKSRIQTCAACRSASGIFEKSRKPLGPVGTSTSRIDLSGARTSRRRVLPSGCTNPSTVTSFGTSWAPVRGASTSSKTATRTNRLNKLLEITKLDTGIGPKYTGRRKKALLEGSHDEAREDESKVIYRRG